MQNEKITKEMREAFYSKAEVQRTGSIRYLDEALSAALAAAEAKPVAWPADGWVMVPVEPTEAMCRANAGTATTKREVWNASLYRAMLAARPPSVDTEARRMAMEEHLAKFETLKITPISDPLAGVNNAKELIRAKGIGRAALLMFQGKDPYPEITAVKAARAARALIPQEGRADA